MMKLSLGVAETTWNPIFVLVLIPIDLHKCGSNEMWQVMKVLIYRVVFFTGTPLKILSASR